MTPFCKPKKFKKLSIMFHQKFLSLDWNLQNFVCNLINQLLLIVWVNLYSISFSLCNSFYYNIFKLPKSHHFKCFSACQIAALGVSAVIGPFGSSDISNSQLNSVFRRFRIPQIITDAGTISNFGSLGSFVLDIGPTPAQEGQITANYIKYFHWQHVAVILSDEYRGIINLFS